MADVMDWIFEWPAQLSGGAVINWLLLDRFTTPLGPGDINATLSEPSGHVRTVTDTALNAVITGGQFKVTAIAGLRDPWLRYTTGWARGAGRMLKFEYFANLAADNTWLVGAATTLTTPDASQTLGILGQTATISAQPINTRIASYTPGTLTDVKIILRSIGHFTVINNTLHHIYRLNNAAIVYPHAMGRSVDAACDLRVDNAGIADLPLTNPTLFPTPTLSDTFSDTVAPLITDGPAKVVINERTGTIIIGHQVRINTVAVSHGNLSLHVKSEFGVSQPPPFSRQGQTVVVPRTETTVTEDKANIVVLPEGGALSEVVRALNAIGATPRDLIAILQAIKRAGGLQADLEIM